MPNQSLVVCTAKPMDLQCLPAVASQLFAEHAVTHYWHSMVYRGTRKFEVYVGAGHGNSAWLAIDDGGRVLFIAVDTTLQDRALCDLLTIMTDGTGRVVKTFTLADMPATKDIFVAQIRHMFGLWFAGTPTRGESVNSPRQFA